MFPRERGSPPLEPTFHLGTVRDEESVEQRTGVKRRGTLQIALAPGRLEIPQVAPNSPGSEQQLARAPDDVIRAEPTTDGVGQLAEAVRRPTGRRFKPQESAQLVPRHPLPPRA